MSRERKKPEDTEVELARVITPMLDMSFQILFFFVVMYQPSAMEGHMDMMLPPAGEGVTKAQATASSVETEIELPAELEVIVRTRDLEESKQVQDGALGKIIVKNSVGEERTFQSLDALKSHLEKVRGSLQNKDDIKIQADGRLKYNFVIAAMDTCKRAGFNNVGFAAPPDLARIIPGVQ